MFADHFRYTLLRWMTLICCLIASSVCNAELSNDEILMILKSRDAQLDNANLHYKHTYETSIPGKILSKIPLEERREILKRGTTIKHSYNKQMAIRGNEVTFNTYLDETVNNENHPRFGFVLFTRRSNVTGSNREYLKQDDGYEELSIRPAGPTRDILLQERMHAEFSFGLGFGKRIKSISSATQTPTGYLVKGIIEPYQIEPCPFEIEIDQDFVVRHATITATTGEALTVFTISTEGTIEDGGFVFPVKGSFKKTLGEHENGEPKGKPISINDYEVQFEKVDWDLSDSEYQDLTHIEMVHGMRVRNYIIGMNYTVGEFEEMENIFEHGKLSLDLFPVVTGESGDRKDGTTTLTDKESFNTDGQTKVISKTRTADKQEPQAVTPIVNSRAHEHKQAPDSSLRKNITAITVIGTGVPLMILLILFYYAKFRKGGVV